VGRAISALCDVLSGDGICVSSFVVLRAVVLGAVWIRAAGLNAVGFRGVVLRVMLHGVY